ncbi:LapA family protein [Hoyosella rhizosphaerae]|uniref:Lipopolysaccharide assembly protein A domain-containing protein n=1 Tax=Hoyosella rhizosphaerae TaxID=1755582 RepID=A0A916UGK9_9ACTN|nr:LapA family protein [Hoyosella rhizosphaerae]MBN4928134.1 LapA family protein [Hoyosella rhizosphaerae]GGC72678.1 hypothetical protein GCM10011410_27160 [Hoyosella rhizosphaerae]
MEQQQKSFASHITAPRIVGIVIAALAAIFILQNRSSVSIALFWTNVTTPLWLTLLAVFVLGWLVGVLTSWRRAAVKKRK